MYFISWCSCTLSPGTVVLYLLGQLYFKSPSKVVLYLKVHGCNLCPGTVVLYFLVYLYFTYLYMCTSPLCTCVLYLGTVVLYLPVQLYSTEGGVAAPRVLKGSQGFGVKCGNLSELLSKVLKKGNFKTKN